MSIRTYAVNCNDAWLNTEGDDISGSYVKYKDHQEVVAALESKCAALAAENAALNKFIKDDCWIWDDKSEEYFDAADCMPETSATDAFLAEVRAQGVEMFTQALRGEAEITKACTFKPVQQFEEFAARADECAAKLRQDANTAELVAAGIITKVGE